MTKPVGLALVGTGRWGSRLAAAVGRSNRLRLVTCFGRDAGRRSGFASEHGCRAADSFEEAIEHPGVEGVVLATPNDVHASQAGMCAEQGRHVFVEKPIAYSLSDAATMETACRRAGVALMVGHAFRRLGAARRVKELLEAGTLGRVVLAEANFSLPGALTPDQWRYYRESCPGGPLMQLGIHHVDTLRYWLGSVERVQGSFARVATSAEIDDVGVALLDFENGARGVITGSYVSPRTFFLRLYGSEAALAYSIDMTVWPDAGRLDEHTTLTLFRQNGIEDVGMSRRDMLVEELEEFASCVKGEAEPETGAAEGTAALAVVLAALESHASGQAAQLS